MCVFCHVVHTVRIIHSFNIPNPTSSLCLCENDFVNGSSALLPNTKLIRRDNHQVVVREHRGVISRKTAGSLTQALRHGDDDRTKETPPKDNRIAGSSSHRGRFGNSLRRVKIDARNTNSRRGEETTTTVLSSKNKSNNYIV